MVYYPAVLIISNKLDFATDFITLKLREKGVAFLRLNRDDLGQLQIAFDPCTPSLTVKAENRIYELTHATLKSIYYRAPTFLREIFQEHVSAEEQLYRTQWAAFVRSLIVFDKIKWVNDPVTTYKAEMKPYQLYYAKSVGFKVPETIVTNNTASIQIQADQLAIKSIDTAIISDADREAFVYTSLVLYDSLPRATYSSPFFVQQGLTPKVDIRITVIAETIIACKIYSEEGIADDWRKYKGQIRYEIFTLPADVEAKCYAFTRGLGLVYAAIDMVIYQSEYYFIEVNPTGEWAWLQQNTGFPFDEIIVRTLL